MFPGKMNFIPPYRDPISRRKLLRLEKEECEFFKKGLIPGTGKCCFKGETDEDGNHTDCMCVKLFDLRCY